MDLIMHFSKCKIKNYFKLCLNSLIGYGRP